jgi:hypothetical protein
LSLGVKTLRFSLLVFISIFGGEEGGENSPLHRCQSLSLGAKNHPISIKGNFSFLPLLSNDKELIMDELHNYSNKTELTYTI